MNDVAGAPLPSSLPIVQPWQSELLSSISGVAHGLTRRVEGLGQADGNIGFSPPRDREDAWAMRRHWCAALDLVPEHLVTLGQIHGRDVRIATQAPSTMVLLTAPAPWRTRSPLPARDALRSFTAR